ncbi:MAG: hypothetical protein AAF492_00310 [Verrucomicrobiota bacterium]
MNETEKKTKPRFDRSSLPFFGLVLVIGLFNLIWPKNYALYAIDHASFISPLFQFQWLLVILGLLFLMARKGDRLKLPKAVLFVVAIAFILSFFIFRSTFPSVHGDGEGGGSPHHGKPVLKEFPKYDARLQSFLGYGLSRLLPENVRFNYNFTSLHINHPVNSAWLILLLLVGAGLVIRLTWLAERSSMSNEAALGFLLTTLASAAGLNAYGHFDSYLIPIALLTAWLLTLYKTHQNPGRKIWWVVLFAGLPVITWAHPVLLYIAGYAGLFGFLLLLKRRLPLWLLLAGAVLYGWAPFAIGRGYHDFFDPTLRHLVGWMLHEKTMALLQAALPALFLIVLLLIRRTVDVSQPIQSVALFMAVSASILIFTLRLGYGLLDEFLYSMFGVLITGAALLLFLTSREKPQLLLYTGLLSLFLFFPRVYLYAGERLLDRFEQHLPREYTKSNLFHGPYKLLAMNVPLNTKKLQDRRLGLLEKGFLEPEPAWEKHRDRSLAFYIVWCYEFDQLERTRGLLERLIDRNSDTLLYLWLEEPDPFQTRSYRGVSKRMIRRACRQILGRKLAANPDNEQLQIMSRTLLAIDRRGGRMPEAP